MARVFMARVECRCGWCLELGPEGAETPLRAAVVGEEHEAQGWRRPYRHSTEYVREVTA